MKDINEVAMDMLFLQNTHKTAMLSNTLTQIDDDYLPEQFYPS